MAKLFVFILSFALCLASPAESRRLPKHCHTRFFHVARFGAVGDGYTDDTEAFQEAWRATCKWPCPATMYIPHGRQYLLQPITFAGSCQSQNITVQIEGELVAPTNPGQWECVNNKCKEWITFEKIEGLSIHGHGTLNGKGTNWWNLDCKYNKHRCGKKATGLAISHSQNVHINNLKFKDSPQMHVAFERSEWIYVSNITINAPWDSPNTDGIHLQHAKHIYIHHSTIKTGDDCISIGDGSSYVDIHNITCGPGHGISIGSLGIKGKEEKVEYVYVNNVTFNGTTNGVRIKTWQGGRGCARHITFEHIISMNSSNPIIIDQFYCPHKKCRSHESKAVKVSDITYRDIKGTSMTQEAVRIACSEANGACRNIAMEDIDLISVEKDDDEHYGRLFAKDTLSYCSNAQTHLSGRIFPPLHCVYH